MRQKTTLAMNTQSSITPEEWAGYHFFKNIVNRIERVASYSGVELDLHGHTQDMVAEILPMLRQNDEVQAKAYIVDHLTGMAVFSGIDLTPYTSGI